MILLPPPPKKKVKNEKFHFYAHLLVHAFTLYVNQAHFTKKYRTCHLDRFTKTTRDINKGEMENEISALDKTRKIVFDLQRYFFNGNLS